MATSYDLKTETETLKSKLSMIDKKIRNWTLEEQAQLAASTEQYQESLLKKYTEEKESLKDNITYKQAEKEKAFEEKQESIKKLKEELENDKKLLQKVIANNEKLETQVQTLEEDIANLKKDIKSTDEDKKKLDYLTKASAIFSQKLGLSFRKVHGKKMQVIFSKINENDPEQIFYFFLQIVNRKYIVTDPDPQVDDLEDLVKDVNNTNNLRQFIIKIRQKFKECVEKEHIMPKV